MDRKSILTKKISKTPLFCDFAEERYLPFAREHKRSWKTDQRYLNAHILPFLGDCPLAEISEKTLKDWCSVLEGSGLAPSSCYRIFWLVKYMLNCAVRWQVLADDSAFKKAVYLRCKKRPPELLSHEEALRLIHLIQEYPGRSSAQAIHLLLLTGAGKAEILNARWEDLDLRRGILLSSQTFTGRVRPIPLNSEARKLIQKLPRREGVPWLFSSANGRRLVSLHYTWNMLRIRLGRPTLRLADLRHCFAGFLIDMGLRRKELNNILGHYLPETLSLLASSSHGRQA